MSPLVDSHTLVWSTDDPSKLSPVAASALRDPSNDIFISAATLWEVSIKVGLGKLAIARPYRDWMKKTIADLGAVVLPIAIEYADVQASLPHHHRDPFDRMLIAQALVEGIPIISADAQFDAYGVQRLW